MTQTTARIKQAGKHFEIIVDLDRALKFRKGLINTTDFLEMDVIFTDHKKGLKAADKDMKECFGTSDVIEIAKKIVKNGEVQLTQEFRDDAKDAKLKQVIDILAKNASDPQTGRPHTPERIKSALEQAGVNIKNTPIESQIPEIVEKLSPFLPIKMQMKRVRIVVPAIYTGKAYGIFNQYKESENWLPNGDLEVVVSVPSGLLMDFFDRLNSITHGAATTEEIKSE